MLTPGSTSYCWNCGAYGVLIDGVYCGWCLNFYQANSRLPRVADDPPITSSRRSRYI